MKKLLIASAVVALTAGMASAEDIKIGISMGFTGPRRRGLLDQLVFAPDVGAHAVGSSPAAGAAGTV